MSWNPSLTRLQNLLAEIYPFKEDLRRLADQAGLPPGFVQLDGPAIQGWHSLLEQASLRQRLAALCEVVSGEYPEQRELAQAMQSALAAQGGGATAAAAAPAAQRALEVARRSLAILEQQAAGYTSLTIPAHLQIELEDKRREVARLEGAALPPASPTPTALAPQPRPEPAAARPPASSPASAAAPVRLPPPLLEAVQRGALALFVGADLPGEASGLPSRRELASGLARKYGLDESLPLGEVAQRVGAGGSRWEFTQYLKDALDTTRREPQSFHRQLARLVRDFDLPLVITTAYDNLFERACQQAGCALQRAVRASEVGFLQPGRPALVKLYGSLEQPDTLTVTAQDHARLLRDKEALVDEVRQALRKSTVLFLGYDLSDPGLRSLLAQVTQEPLARRHYAVWPGLAPDEKRAWGDQNIEILEGGLYALSSAPQAQAGAPAPQMVAVEAQGKDSGDRYVIYISNSSGIAIGDGARVEIKK